MTIRNELAMKLLAMRQLIYDAPAQNLPEMQRAVEQLENYLRSLSCPTSK